MSTIQKNIHLIHEDFAQRMFFESEGPSANENRRISERAMIYYISTGDVLQVKNLIGITQTTPYGSRSSVDTSIIGDLSQRPLEQAIGLLISGITLFTRAAIDGGLPEYIAYSLSDAYINHSFTVKNANDIYRLLEYAMYDFTNEVYKYKYRNCSSATRTCCEYILRHLHEKITLDDLSKVCKKTPNYVSDIFAKELGIRPQTFIRNQKLEYAHHILETADISINSLAYLLAFPSTSSFITYFKDKYKVTPSQFKKHLK